MEISFDSIKSCAPSGVVVSHPEGARIIRLSYGTRRARFWWRDSHGGCDPDEGWAVIAGDQGHEQPRQMLKSIDDVRAVAEWVGELAELTDDAAHDRAHLVAAVEALCSSASRDRVVIELRRLADRLDRARSQRDIAEACQ